MINGEWLTPRGVNHSPLIDYRYFERRLKNSNNLFT